MTDEEKQKLLYHFPYNGTWKLYRMNELTFGIYGKVYVQDMNDEYIKKLIETCKKLNSFPENIAWLEILEYELVKRRRIKLEKIISNINVK